MRIRDLSSDVCSSDLFGVKPGDTIVELWPGGGWYTEILAPLTRAGGGTLYAAAPAGRPKTIEAWRTGKPDDYGAVRLAEFPHKGGAKVSDGSADVVLTFRNVHNWRFGGSDNTVRSEEPTSELQSLLRISYAVLCVKKKNS